MSSMNEDRLTMLPEEIISLILSRMPTKYAVRTSILSKRWRDTWMLITSLDFDDIHLRRHSEDVLSKFVDHVMNVCKSSQIQLFRLHFSHKWITRPSVSNWIDKAVRLNVCELDVRLLKFDLPLSLFTCNTLTKLKIGHGNAAVWECPWPVHLPCLKTLDVAVLKNPFVNAFMLISGCPMLENLSLEVTARITEDAYIFNIPTLKRLKLTVECAFRNNKVVLNVPNLEYLFVGGNLASVIVVEDLSSLVEGSVSFNGITSDHLLVELLKAMSRVRSLSIEKRKGINGNSSLSVEQVPFSAALPIFPNLKRLEFKSFWRTRLILQFLESCPKLKDLCIEKLACSTDRIEQNLVPTCIHTNLTSIKLSNCSGLASELQFLEYMLGNAEVLKTVTITCEIFRKKWLRALLLELRRACMDCEIRFIDK